MKNLVKSIKEKISFQIAMFRYNWRWQGSVRETRFYFWLGSLIPKRLRYFIVVKECAKATTGEHGNTVVPELSMMDMLDRIQPA